MTRDTKVEPQRTPNRLNEENSSGSFILPGWYHPHDLLLGTTNEPNEV